MEWEEWRVLFYKQWSRKSYVPFKQKPEGREGFSCAEAYISYLLLHNKSPPNSVAQNNKHLLSQFLWLGNLGVAQLDVLTQSFSRSQSSCWLRLQSSKGWKEDSTQRAHLMVSVRRKILPTMILLNKHEVKRASIWFYLDHMTCVPYNGAKGLFLSLFKFQSIFIQNPGKFCFMTGVRKKSGVTIWSL